MKKNTGEDNLEGKIMKKIFDQIEKRLEGSDLYLGSDGNGKEMKDTF